MAFLLQRSPMNPTIRRSERKLPEEARDHLRTILDTYDRLKTERSAHSAGDDEEVRKLRTMLAGDPNSLWWCDIAQGELCVADLLDDEAVRPRLAVWRSRMNDVLGDARFSQYVASSVDVDSAKPAQLKAELLECIRSVYYFYGAYGIAAKSRSTVTRSLLIVAAVVLAVQAIAAIIFAWQPWCRPADHPLIGCLNTDLFESMLMASAAAVLGSVVSVQRRLQDPKIDVDPFYRYIQTKADWFSIAFMSPLFGAIFGLMLYGLLASQLLSTTLVNFDEHGIPKGAAARAALLVLGFVAGFAEQLIPDALTRIASRAFGNELVPVSLPARTVPVEFGNDQKPPTSTDTAKSAVPGTSDIATSGTATSGTATSPASAPNGKTTLVSNADRGNSSGAG